MRQIIFQNYKSKSDADFQRQIHLSKQTFFNLYSFISSNWNKLPYVNQIQYGDMILFLRYLIEGGPFLLSYENETGLYQKDLRQRIQDCCCATIYSMELLDFNNLDLDRLKQSAESFENSLGLSMTINGSLFRPTFNIDGTLKPEMVERQSRQGSFKTCPEVQVK